MNALTNRANYRSAITFADWLLMVALIALPGLVAFAALEWAVTQ